VDALNAIGTDSK